MREKSVISFLSRKKGKSFTSKFKAIKQRLVPNTFVALLLLFHSQQQRSVKESKSSRTYTMHPTGGNRGVHNTTLHAKENIGPDMLRSKVLNSTLETGLWFKVEKHVFEVHEIVRHHSKIM